MFFPSFQHKFVTSTNLFDLILDVLMVQGDRCRPAPGRPLDGGAAPGAEPRRHPAAQARPPRSEAEAAAAGYGGSGSLGR